MSVVKIRILMMGVRVATAKGVLQGRDSGGGDAQGGTQEAVPAGPSAAHQGMCSALCPRLLHPRVTTTQGIRQEAL